MFVREFGMHDGEAFSYIFTFLDILFVKLTYEMLMLCIFINIYFQLTNGYSWETMFLSQKMSEQPKFLPIYFLLKLLFFYNILCIAILQWHILGSFQSKIVVITVLADGLAPPGARPSMMMSSNGNIFLVNSPHKGQWQELWCFLWSLSEQTVE